MNEPTIDAAYLHGLSAPAIRVGAITYTRTPAQAEQLAAELLHAAMQARLAERQRALRSSLHPTANEVPHGH